jgi:NAD(P)-dependent dehydrogenase (short-subunit alcohol dehydrogenase family)
MVSTTEVLDGRVAIATGGGHGIGKAHCECLAQNGAAVSEK